MSPRRIVFAFVVLPVFAVTAQQPDRGAVRGPVVVRTDAELAAALEVARAGTRIEIAPGEYRGGIHAHDLRGEPGRPIVLCGGDPARPPRFVGGGTGLHLVDPRHVQLQDLHFTGATANGLNLDDGGKYVAQPRGIVLRRLRITDIGSRGNHDGIKLSGLHGFRIEDCVIERWGSGSGSGIDMVGCHAGEITGCTLRHHAEAETTGGSGIQAKGGSRDLTIRGNRFEHAGERAINLGGSTGLQYFRPPLDRWPGTERYEAAAIVVEGNTIVGSAASIAFVGVDSATVRFNTIVDPRRWALRILQETREPGFVPSRRGVFSDNVVVFRSEWSSGGVNIGPGTAPETFTFARNAWFCRDLAERSKPTLPAVETEGLYGRDPLLDEQHRLGSNSPARGRGADAVPPVAPR